MKRIGGWLSLCIGLVACGGPPHRSSPEFEESPFFVRRSAVVDRESSEIAWYDQGTRTAWRLVGDTPDPLAEFWAPDPIQFRLLDDGSVAVVGEPGTVHLAAGTTLESVPAIGVVNGTGHDDLWIVTQFGSGLRRCRLGPSGAFDCEDIAAPDAVRFCVRRDGVVHFAIGSSLFRHDDATSTLALIVEPLEALRCTDDGLLGWGAHSVVWDRSDGFRSYDVPAPVRVAAADRFGDDVFVLTREQEQSAPGSRDGVCVGGLTTPCGDDVSGPPGFEPWSQYVLMRAGDPQSGDVQELAHQDCTPPAECWRETVGEVAVDRERVLLMGGPQAWIVSR